VRVMTIHASKGRQFDVVILPDLDDSMLRNPPAILSSRQDLLEPFDCISIRPPKQVLAFDDRLTAMKAAADQRKIVEELCALYVAMTRARTGLEMIVHPNEAGKLSGSMAGILRGALFGQAPALEEQQLWQHENSKYVPDKSQPAASTEPEIVELKLAPAKSPRLPPLVSPSGLEGGGFIQLKNYLSFSDAPSFDRGTVLHRWFELVSWLDEAMPSRAELIAAIADVSVPTDQVNALMEEFSAACARPAISAILRRSAYASYGPEVKLELWRERRFAVRLDGVILQGQLDRVVIVRDASGNVMAADLIDFKSDRISAEEDSLAKRVTYYSPQIRAYRKAVAQLTGLAEIAITSKLAFTSLDAVRLVSP
jgi:ATP-dependent helicase/nuclease subunit A